MTETAITLRGLLAEAAGRLRAAGIEAPAREALRIWADLWGREPGAALMENPAVAPEEAGRFAAAVERRAAGEPLAYVTGWAGFRRLVLRADRRALIPRPETEGLVDLVLARAPAGRVADVATGGGCIALSLATEGRYRAVVGVDRSSEALALARENRALVGAPVELVRGDLTGALASGAFDAVVSNPPYVSEAEYAALPESVRAWEPREALESGPDGMAATTALLDDARRVLRPGGWLVVEVDARRADAAARLAGRLGWTAVEVRMDLFGRERYLLARRSEKP